MWKLALFSLVCSARAVTLYGHQLPTHLADSMIQQMSQLDGTEHSFGSFFHSTDLNTQNGSDFLERELGIKGMTLSEWLAEEEASPASSSLLPYASPTASMSISQRDSVDQLRCAHNAVEDKLSATTRGYICSIAQGAVSGISSAVVVILDSSVCSDSSNGAQVKCRTVVALTGNWVASGGSSALGVFCNDFMEKNGKQCSDQGLSGSRDRMKITVRNSQLLPTCDDYTDGPCREIEN